MRARAANNFSTEDLDKIVAQCHQAGVKAYLTLNTVLYDHDMQLMRRIMDRAKKKHIDAVIVSDHAAMMYGKSIGLSVHASTQLNISNIETVEFFAAFADVMVLARELNLKQVADISREIKRRKIKGPSGELIKLEIFAHGALCMAISGKCHLSLHTQYASANRGACVQNCRRQYIVTDKEDGHEFEIDNEYIMSAKDLCTIDLLDQVLAAGVSVLKIEGRGRSADYVVTTTRCYKEAVQAVIDKSYTPEKISTWRHELSKVYNRGFWEGYYLGRKLGEWSNQPRSVALEKKVYVARGSRYYPKLKVGEFLLETGKLKTGDTVMLIGKGEGVHQFTLSDLRVNGIEASEAMKGDKITFPLDVRVREDDKLYKIVAGSEA
ncbi:MAG: U32 family peptidase [Cyclobacteriaceae bacterium]|nr:U32 family peptidase [Cyclobacteriaceae bacterium]